MKVISDMAFDAVDHDGSGEIEAPELAEMMSEVAVEMGLGVNTVTEGDVIAIMNVLDENSDGIIDKSEFLNYLMLTFECVLGEEDQ
tara:strand:+ start:261 stop:518 length:258 start_codon:yes stop_codon:yes gene_type:complete